MRPDLLPQGGASRRQAERRSVQARTRVTLLFRSGWIFSFSFRLTQGMLDIFPFQGCLQTIGFLPSLHVLLPPYPRPPSPTTGKGAGELFDQPDSYLPD